MTYKKELLACVLGASACVHGLNAVEEGSSVREALSQGTTSLNVRLRYESVDESSAGTDKTGSALTARAILSYKTLSYNNWSMGLTFESTAPLTDDDNYNDKVNGNTADSVIADPQHAEVDEFYVNYSGIEHANFKLGRQVINLDNQRFIGAVGWRQNRQTFDAFKATYKKDELNVTYAYLFNANRIFSDSAVESLSDSPLAAHILNAAYKIEDIGTVVGYIYALDFIRDADDTKDLITIGARFSGKRALNDGMTLTYEAELAQQSDYADNNGDVGTSYLHLRAGVDVAKISASIGYELLGSDDGVTAFSTPLATLHKFNGWSDQFLGTPASGLSDVYLSVGASFDAVPGLKTKAVFHQFDEDEGSHSATEFDLVATYACQEIEGVSAGVKAAVFSDDGMKGDTDTTKFWLWTAYAF